VQCAHNLFASPLRQSSIFDPHIRNQADETEARQVTLLHPLDPSFAGLGSTRVPGEHWPKRKAVLQPVLTCRSLAFILQSTAYPATTLEERCEGFLEDALGLVENMTEEEFKQHVSCSLPIGIVLLPCHPPSSSSLPQTFHARLGTCCLR